MRTKLCAVALVLFSIAYAQEEPRFEIGVIVGEPTGLSAKYWLTPRSAIGAATGWSFAEGVLDASADYLFHFFPFDLASGTLPVYFGLGAALRASDDDAFVGARVPLGISYYFPEAPFDVFLEIAPLMEVIPETKLRVEGGIGLRLTF